MAVVDHAALTLWVVFKSGEGDDGARVTVNDRDAQVGSLNQLQDFRIRVDPVVVVIFADLDQVDDGVGVVGVCATDDD